MTHYYKHATKEEQVKIIIDTFDFDKVHTVMKALDWKWWDSDETPTHGRMVNVAQDLLLSVYSEAVRSYARKEVGTSTGGFEAIARRNDDNDIYLELKFAVTAVDFCDFIE